MCAHVFLPLTSVFCVSALPHLAICQSFFLCPHCSLCLIWQPLFVLLFSSSSFCQYIKLTKRIAHWWGCWPVYGERDENQQNNNSTFENLQSTLTSCHLTFTKQFLFRKERLSIVWNDLMNFKCPNSAWKRFLCLEFNESLAFNSKNTLYLNLQHKGHLGTIIPKSV